MPIKIQYGSGERSSAGQIIAQAGQANLAREQQSRLEADRLRQQRDMQLVQIDAQADQQREAAEVGMARDAIRFGLDQQLREDEYFREVELNKQKAKDAVDQFTYEYTSKQRQQMSQWTNALNDLKSNPDLSDGERESMAFQLEQQIAGIEKTATLAKANEPKYPDGEGARESWLTKEGGVAYRKEDGTVGLFLKPSETTEGIDRKAEIEKEEALNEWKHKIATEIITVKEGLIETKRPRTGKEIADRYRAFRESESLIEEIDREFEGKASKDSSAPPPFKNDATYQQWLARPENWVQAARASGLEVQEEDLNLGPELGPLQVELRALKKKANLSGAEAMRANELIEALRRADPGAGIEEFAVRGQQSKRGKGLRKQEPPFALSNMSGLF